MVIQSSIDFIPYTLKNFRVHELYVLIIGVYFQIIVLICLFIHTSTQLKKQKTSAITDIEDIKEFKKLLRTKTNVMVLYINNVKATQSVLDVFKESAGNMKGQATLVAIDCSNRCVGIVANIKH